MTFKRMIGVPMMLAGLAAGLLVAKPVRAQQEVDPTFFDGPSATSQTTIVARSASPNLAEANKAAAGPATSLAPRDVEAWPVRGTLQAATVVLTAGFGLIVFLGRRKAMPQAWRQGARSLTSSPAGGTAN